MICKLESEHDDLRNIMSASSKPERPRSATIGARDSNKALVRINQGKIVYEYAAREIGVQVMSRILQTGEKLRLPRGFWPACCKVCFDRVCTDAFRKSLRKALYLVIHALRKGATTTCGMLGLKKSVQKRTKGRQCLSERQHRLPNIDSI